MSAQSTALLTTRQVADRLGLSPEVVLRKWRRGELPGYRLGSNCLRFDEAELEAWLAALPREPLKRPKRQASAVASDRVEA